jgi:hypothetical protein
MASSILDTTQRITINPTILARDVVLAGKSYHDWLPYTEHTLKRAKIYFQDGFPFNRLSDTQKGSLKRFHNIRNAIAHKSSFAQKRFEDDVIGHLVLLPRERKPAGFLRSVFRRPAQTQYENVVAELEAMASKICQ